ncbi:MAG: hypothetical protein P4M11_14600 [Candidatus Pacebacteria bacterium]|nr:hypothetical protein [Candidatus Paceibacterota bacterium]
MISAVQETVKAFYQQYNYGKTGTKDLMQYCRPSVERYMFSKLYDTVFAMYALKSEDDDRAVVKKMALLQQTCRGRNLMRQLEFKEKYMVGSEEEEKAGKLGYESSIKCVNKLEKSNSPTEKLASIMQMYAEMRTNVIDFSKGKAELLAMDDQMPVYIYIMAMCSLTRPTAEFNFLFDYLKYQEKSYDTEQLLVTNLQVRRAH